jgi:DNA polymerase-1
MIALIDGDIVCFRAAFSAEQDEEEFIPLSRVDGMMEEILHSTGVPLYEIWLSGEDNFRYTVYPEYKANRLKAARPKWEKLIKNHLVEKWGAMYSKGCEADDMLGVRQMECFPDSVIVTIDKDLDMIPGMHFNFVKKELYDVKPEKAMRNFYYQCLVGDTADGIKGVPGIGPIKAERILSLCDNEQEMFNAVRDAYALDEAFEMNAKCLWIWRKMNDTWNGLKDVEKASSLAFSDQEQGDGPQSGSA